MEFISFWAHNVIHIILKSPNQKFEKTKFPNLGFGDFVVFIVSFGDFGANNEIHIILGPQWNSYNSEGAFTTTQAELPKAARDENGPIGRGQSEASEEILFENQADSCCGRCVVGPEGLPT